MKKTIAILLVLLLAGLSIFATETPVASTEDPATILVKSKVADFSAFGVTLEKITHSNAFNSIVEFQEKVSSSVSKTVSMLELKDPTLVGYLSGINNTATPVALTVSVGDLASGTNSIELKLQASATFIPAAASSKFGTLKDFPIKVQEKTAGKAALAPAGTYSATVTISLTSG